MNTENKNATPMIDDEFYNGLVLELFDRSIKQFDDDTAAGAAQLVNIYMAKCKENVTQQSVIFNMMCGFLLGLHEGLKIARTLDGVADQTQATE